MTRLICIIIIGVLNMAAVRPSSRLTVVTNIADVLPLQVVIADFLAQKELGPESTRKAYANDLDHLQRFMSVALSMAPSKVMFHDLNKIAIESFKKDRIASESRTTARRRVECVRALCRFVSEKYRVENRAKDVERVSVHLDTRIVGLTDSEFKRLLEVAKHQHPRDRFLVHLLAFTGMRNIDARELLLGQISDDWCFFEGFLSKGEKYRTVPITAHMRRELMTYLEWRHQFPTLPDWPVLIDVRTKPWDSKPEPHNPKTIWRVVHQVARKADISKDLCHPHRLRHTFAYRALEHMIPIYGFRVALTTLSETLGHSSIEVTMRYLRLKETQMYEALRGLSEV